MATKDWKKVDWGFSEGSMWHSFRKGGKIIWVGKRNGFFIASIDGEKPSPKYKTQSGAMKFARRYMRTH